MELIDVADFIRDNLKIRIAKEERRDKYGDYLNPKLSIELYMYHDGDLIEIDRDSIDIEDLK